MEIKDNTEHLSLSQSRSNMKQFNKQLQAVPREMMERLEPRGRAGRLQTARCGLSTRASRWCLATVLWWKMTRRQNQNNGPVQGFLGGLPFLKSISAGQDANSRVGTRRGAQESFLHLFRGMYVCVVCWLDFCLIHSHGSYKKECTKLWKFAKNPSW